MTVLRQTVNSTARLNVSNKSKILTTKEMFW